MQIRRGMFAVLSGVLMLALILLLAALV